MKLKLFTVIILISLTYGCVSTGTEQVQNFVEQQVEEVDEPMQEEVVDTPTPEEDSSITTSFSPDDTLRIGAFNVQVFGVTKADKPEVMDVLADIVRTYDIVAIQEIRDKSETALPELVELVNSDGSSYDYVVSERLGRTTSKEQYAYIYDSTAVELTGDPQTYPEPEGTDPFHRQPYIASIKAINGDYDAVLMVIHTDPDEATEEINALDDVLEYSESIYSDEKDFIIMGDLNADGSYFNEDGTSDLDEYNWLIDDDWDTTTKSTDYTYDRIIMTDISELNGQYGVFMYDVEYGLTEEETTAVSDHYPVFVDVSVSGDVD
ncbi:endonuclease/exonuclease/phosphatase family protein [Methanolobus profundi]|uniref:Endonuclease/Exonuclease/phosphatase family protein n=1 Tax=Methanolobus profundi TaxID=487685 RepID=A0A1I4RCR5_9EURY|nr:endonuclease/exonuclease/phosphatase family protein [Methanolobus profundi]SFM49703.1 Endonuclease/Exonuclease/phosphatase family protein [Methanolobus profundi]